MTTKILFTAFGAALILSPIMNTSAQTEPRIESAKVIGYEPNPDGLQIGFWANYSNSKGVVEDFGLRPIERVGFTAWRSMEKEPGVYDFAGDAKWEKNAHRAGATVVSAVNVMFTKAINPQGMDAIPPFYPQDIRDPKTREAARRFLAAYVENKLNVLGPVVLTLDYELMWFALPRTPEIRQTYRDWFVEAAEVCRQTAAKLGRTKDLQIVCIVNSDPLTIAKGLIGGENPPNHEPQQWLLDVANAADIFAIDSYGQDKANPTSAEGLMREVRFWVNHYAKDKPIYVTESGFSSSEESGKTKPGYHARGTEAEQAEFLKNVFDTLRRKNEPGNEYLKNVQAYCVWMYLDSKEKDDPVEQHFGLLRFDRSRKPAWHVVKSSIDQIERSPLSPWRRQPSRDVSNEVSSGAKVPLRYINGTRHDGLELAITGAKPETMVELTFDQPVSLVVKMPDGSWKALISEEKEVHRLVLKEIADDRGSLQVFPTSAKFPVEINLVRASFATGS